MEKILQTLLVVFILFFFGSCNNNQSATETENAANRKDSAAVAEAPPPQQDVLQFPALTVDARDLLKAIRDADPHGNNYNRLLFQFYPVDNAGRRNTFRLTCHIVNNGRESLKQPGIDLLKVASGLPAYKDDGSTTSQLILPQLELTKVEVNKLGISENVGAINFLPGDTTIGGNRYINYRVECPNCPQKLTQTELNPSPPAKPK
jgi:hypothetical protein